MRVKGSLYERASHVPMIVKGPAVAHPGSVCSALVSAVDLFPTILELRGAPLPPSVATHPLDGVSLVPLLQGTATSVRDHVYVDMTNSLSGGGYAVRDEQYELLRIQNQLPAHMEMYDLVADPMETSNLLAGQRSAAAESELQRFLAILDAIRPDGWSEVFGSNCTGTGGLMQLAAQTPPTVGQTFFYRCDNRPLGCTLRVGVIGFSNQTNHGVPLPVPLDPFGMTGCSLLVEITGYTGIGMDGLGLIRIPPFMNYSGMSFYMQAFLNDPFSAGSPLVASTGLHCVIGS
jgi:hypothetical protein